LDVAADCGGDCSCDCAGASGPVAACAFRRFGLISEAAIRNPQRATIAVDRTFKFVFNSNMTGTIGTQLVKMWFSAL